MLSDLLTAAIRDFFENVLEVSAEDARTMVASIDLDAVADDAKRWTDVAAGVMARIQIGERIEDPDVS